MPNSLLILGSNLGNKAKNLQETLHQLSTKAGEILTVSAVYETSPWGKQSDFSYYNQAVELDTSLDPAELLKTVQEIEKDLGRTRQERWGDRTLDIDILFYDDQVIEELGLQIPHPEIQNRRFVLVPLAEIAPNRIHPILLHSISTLLYITKDTGEVNRLIRL